MLNNTDTVFPQAITSTPLKFPAQMFDQVRFCRTNAPPAIILLYLSREGRVTQAVSALVLHIILPVFRGFFFGYSGFSASVN